MENTKRERGGVETTITDGESISPLIPGGIPGGPRMPGGGMPGGGPPRPIMGGGMPGGGMPGGGRLNGACPGPVCVNQLYNTEVV